ncbi:MAG: hypothetical protein K2M20_13785 [Lachnospiraceae bacterium]|nr:hypothetical protein [Lachnospiraceae bacterium]
MEVEKGVCDGLCLFVYFSSLSDFVSSVFWGKGKSISKNGGPHFPEAAGAAKEEH